MDHSALLLWELIVGLEIHVELNTRSKLFSSAPNHFGDEPNTNISIVCTGQPGALPVLNQEAVHKAVLLGCALGAHVAPYSRFDRKSYFYPDSPRNFQITQFEMPIIIGGTVIADIDGEPRSFPVNRAHLEDDAGMLKHFQTFAGVDYNRAGVPLIEIVSEPCFRSAKEAVAYAMSLKALLQYLHVSDCNMEEGSLRMDVNISVRPKGAQELRNKIEIKNMNSFNFLAMAIESEFKRQVQAYTTHHDQDPKTVIQQATYRWDPERKETILMRVKESAEDYRYFPEPDLPPLILDPAYIEAVHAQLPELPYAREKRYRQTLGLAQDAAAILVNEKALSDYFEKALAFCPTNPKGVANWILVEFTGRFKDSGRTLWTSGLPPQHVGELVAMIESGTITGKIAKMVADEMVAHPSKSVSEIVQSNPLYQPVQDESALKAIVQQVLQEHPQSIVDFKSGRTRAFGFLVGQVMKATQGQASPPVVNRLLQDALDAS